jgi:hypothetical protein
MVQNAFKRIILTDDTECFQKNHKTSITDLRIDGIGSEALIYTNACPYECLNVKRGKAFAIVPAFEFRKSFHQKPSSLN